MTEYRNKEKLEELYIEQNLTQTEIAEKYDVSHTTINNWVQRFDLEKPWKDREKLYEKYVEEGLTTYEIAKEWRCRDTTISKWLRRHDIQTLSKEECMRIALDERRVDHAAFYTNKRGYEKWATHDQEFYTHRLLAVAKYGVEEVKDKQVHHKNGVKWDNRPENIEVMTNSEHQKLHIKERERHEEGYLK